MGDHIIKHFTDTNGMHGCRCRCGWAPPVRYAIRQRVDDEVFKHEQNVARARAGLKGRNPTLEDEYQWYLERAADPQESPESKALWERMAREVGRRLGLEAPDNTQEVLW